PDETSRAEITELKKEKAEFLAKEVGLMARIVELEQSAKESAENTKLRDVEIDELRSRVSKLEQKDSQNDSQNLQTENASASNTSDITSNSSHFVTASGKNTPSSDITNNTSARMCRLTPNSDIYQEKDSRCPESPIHTEPKSPEDKMDLSCGNTETIPSKNDQAGNLCDMKTVPSGNDRDENLSCGTETISSENDQTEISVECDKNEIVEQDNTNSTEINSSENRGELEIRSSASSAQHLSYLFKTAIRSRQQEILIWYYYSLEFENKVEICEEIDQDSDPSEVKIQVSAPDDSRSGDAIAPEDSNYDVGDDSFNNNEGDDNDDGGYCGLSDDDEGYYYNLNTGETYRKSDCLISAY
ncbi:10580_t:CDS:2, partial [Diversispora eburnea]